MKAKKKETFIPVVSIDKRLNKYDNVVLFPKKLELANQLLSTIDPSFFKK